LGFAIIAYAGCAQAPVITDAENANDDGGARPLTLEAGLDLMVREGEVVNLLGEASGEPGEPFAYLWTQLSGPPVALVDSRSARTSFIAPQVAREASLTLRLQVSQGSRIQSDQVSVTVRNVPSVVRLPSGIGADRGTGMVESPIDARPGDIIVGPGIDGSGVLRWATETRSDVILTDAMTVSEALEALDVTDARLDLRVDGFAPAYSQPAGRSRVIPRSNDCLVDFSNTTLLEGSDYWIGVEEGCISFSPEVSVEVVFGFFTVESATVTLSGEITGAFSLAAYAQRSIEIKPDPMQIGPIDPMTGDIVPFEAPFQGLIGPLPVWGVAKLFIYVGAEAELEASGSAAAGASAFAAVDCGAHFDGDAWTPFIEPTLEFESSGPVFELEGDFAGRVYVRPRVEVWLYGVVGPWLEVEPSADLAGHFDLTGIDWTLGASVEAELGGKLTILEHDLIELGPFSLLEAEDTWRELASGRIDFGVDPDDSDDCPDDTDKTEPGQCGCGRPDTDGDGDGVADCIDNCRSHANPYQEDRDLDAVGDACDGCPDDPSKIEEGECGCGNPDVPGCGGGEEIISPPVISGPGTGEPGEQLCFAATGATSNLGHSIELGFDWGDGQNSGWGNATQCHTYSTDGGYTQYARARCKVHPDVVSALSVAHSVTIGDAPPPLGDADLIVDRVVVDGGGERITVRDGQSATIEVGIEYVWTIYVRNQGPGAAGASDARIGTNDGSGDCTVMPLVDRVWADYSVDALPAGAEDSHPIGPWTWTDDLVGTYSLVARSDRDNEVPETDENNNDFCATLVVVEGPGCGDGSCSGDETCSSCPEDCGPCGSVCGDGDCEGTENCTSCSSDCGECPGACSCTTGPDLIVDRIEFVGGGRTIVARNGASATIRINTQYNWTVYLRNAGTQSANSSSAFVGANDGQGACDVFPSDRPWGAFSIPSLAGCAERGIGTGPWVWTEDLLGTYSVTARADRDNAVAECDEGNNDFCVTLHVQP
jgi:hypothetical protein